MYENDPKNTCKMLTDQYMAIFSTENKMLTDQYMAIFSTENKEKVDNEIFTVLHGCHYRCRNKRKYRELSNTPPQR